MARPTWAADADDRDLEAALAELLSERQHLTRRMLGAAVDAEPGGHDEGADDGPGGVTYGPVHGASFGWFAHGPSGGSSPYVGG